MNLLPDAEQTQLLDAAIDYLRTEAPVGGGEPLAAARARMGRAFFTRIAALGWIGLGLEEDKGGVGYTLAEEALFFREFGRHLVSPAMLGAVLGARVASGAGKADIAAAILAGEALVGLGIGRGDARIGEETSGAFQLFETDGADYALFCDETGAALISLEALSGAQTGTCLDERLHLATVALNAAPAAAYVKSDDVFRRGVVLSAAMLAGVAEAARDVSVDYAKTRQQFGQPIGAFQAIKHRCADMAVRCEAATSQVFHAALSVRQGLANSVLDASAAKAVAGEAAMENASGSVQVHGGMGFTDQITPHLYVKRSRILDQLFGDRRQHLDRVLSAPIPE